MFCIYDIKFVYEYGITGPAEEPDLYQRIRAYAFANKLAPEDFVGGHLSFTLLRQFFRKIEELTGFKHPRLRRRVGSGHERVRGHTCLG